MQTFIRSLLMAILSFAFATASEAAAESGAEWNLEIRLLAWDSDQATNFFVIRFKGDSVALMHESRVNSWPAIISATNVGDPNWVKLPPETTKGFFLGLDYLRSGLGTQGTAGYLDVLIMESESGDNHSAPTRLHDLLERDLEKIAGSPMLQNLFRERFGAEASTMVRYQEILKRLRTANQSH